MACGQTRVPVDDSDTAPRFNKGWNEHTPKEKFSAVIHQVPAATFRGFTNIGRGELSIIEGLAGAAEWLGVDSAKPIGDKVAKWQEAVFPENPTYSPL